ncbi:MAG: outer membrane lipoprotein-sorting protein [Myxococcota bacterium]|jgi:hypothetical protein|nr:outer membrane lipoprotein-sorting protein [Myxococcota bacterium]
MQRALGFSLPAAACLLLATAAPRPAAAQPAPPAAAALAATPAPALTGKAIMEKVDQKNRSADEVIESKMRLTEGTTIKERSLKMTVKTAAGYQDKTLIRFSEPGDLRGTGFLIFQHGAEEDELWMYLPAVKKTKRLAATERKDAFVGSDFANEDLRNENLLAYDYTLLRQEKCPGSELQCWIVEAKPATAAEKKGTGYCSRQIWVSPDFLVRQVDYYTKESGDKPTKTLSFLDFTSDPAWKGFERPARSLMVNHKKGTQTEFVFDNTKRVVNGGVDEAGLSQRALEKP